MTGLESAVEIEAYFASKQFRAHAVSSFDMKIMLRAAILRCLGGVASVGFVDSLGMILFHQTIVVLDPVLLRKIRQFHRFYNAQKRKNKMVVITPQIQRILEELAAAEERQPARSTWQSSRACSAKAP